MFGDGDIFADGEAMLLEFERRFVILAAGHAPVEDVVCTVASFADSMVVRSAHSEVAMLRLRVMSLGHFTQYLGTVHGWV